MNVQTASTAAARPTPRDASTLARWLTLSLDHVGRGMLLVEGNGRLLYANRQARQALDEGHPLQLLDGRLQARRSRDDAALLSALGSAAGRGLRRMLYLGNDNLPVAVLPLRDEDGGVALVSLSRAPDLLDLALPSFARQHGLTEAETEVLAALAAGSTPADVAGSKGVRLSTVRTQIGSIRTKTATRSIRALIERVAALPPMPALLQ